MTQTRLAGLGETMSAAILFGAFAAGAVIILGVHNEQSEVAIDDIRSRMDILRDQAVEQIDVSSTAWNGTKAGVSNGTLTLLVSNYGDFETSIPFAIYDRTGNLKTNGNETYVSMTGSTLFGPCTQCRMYNETLDAKTTIRIDVPAWPGVDGVPDSLILITNAGRAVLVGEN